MGHKLVELNISLLLNNFFCKLQYYQSLLMKFNLALKNWGIIILLVYSDRKPNRVLCHALMSVSYLNKPIIADFASLSI